VEISDDALRKKHAVLEGGKINTHEKRGERSLKIYVLAEEKDRW